MKMPIILQQITVPLTSTIQIVTIEVRGQVICTGEKIIRPSEQTDTFHFGLYRRNGYFPHMFSMLIISLPRSMEWTRNIETAERAKRNQVRE